MSGSAERPGLACDGANPLALERQLCFALYAASRAMTRAYQPMLQALDITYPQYLVLLVLWERDGTVAAGDDGAAISVGALGRQLMLDSGTLTPLLKRMEIRGLLDRRRGTEDERVTVVTLTDAGRALRPQALAWVEKQRDSTKLTHRDVKELHAGLWKLLEALGGDLP
ncbi:MarR family winged helix-turn-helix transcriptional regulator [Microbulbifer hainanensis]|uniref:MarR family winged helix-turn-helix transcriptional regulator n=1 Tax=Microbulbifer hainanensis TaxID=2735675 RepID=UPI0029C019A3|nr:MarR family transcriptional regulator [Microbulbifer hainanensis]